MYMCVLYILVIIETIYFCKTVGGIFQVEKTNKINKTYLSRPPSLKHGCIIFQSAYTRIGGRIIFGTSETMNTHTHTHGLWVSPLPYRYNHRHSRKGVIIVFA